MRLKRNVAVWAKKELPTFNSIKVRLKRVEALVHQAHQRFQFHKGAIETLFLSNHILGVCVFQFHKGAIETTYEVAKGHHFKVFQFHKGAIETP